MCTNHSAVGMGKISETLFYKRRLIYRGHRDEYERREPDHDEYHFKWVGGSVKDSARIQPQYDKLVNSIGAETIEARLEQSDCSLGYVTHEETGELSAYTWVLHPSSEPIWHDKYRTEVGEALSFHTYVFEKHRRKGVFSFLHFKARNKIFDELADEFVSIVEASNEPMHNAYDKYGWTTDGTNNLVKFFGINVLASIKDEDRSIRAFVPTLDQLP